MEERVSKRRGRAVIVLLILLLAALVVVGLVSALKIGFAAGIASAGAGLVVYQVPAFVFDWPRLTLQNVLAFFSAAFDWFLDLFSW
jgi:hypothetical protein